MKKFLSLIMAMVIMASLAVPAFAAETDPDPGIADDVIVDTGIADDGTVLTDNTDDGTVLADDLEAAVLKFSDVPSTHTFYAGITSCAAKGITNGYADGTYRPGNDVTRAQFAVMLSRAFYPSEVEALQGQATGKAWYWANLKALHNKALLRYTSFATERAWDSTVNVGISRYDMAQLMTNIMSYKGFRVSDAEKTAAQSKITDYKSIPSQYQDAVKTVYALGIINGYKDGSFNGTGTMNRGAGAAVIYRMQTYVPTTAKPSNPVDDGNYDDGKDKPITTPPSTNNNNTGSNTSTEAPKPTTVTPYTTKTETGTKWTIPDNGFGEGYLNNGKPITEANVLAMLTEAKKIWPHDMEWSENKNSTTNNYYGRVNAGKTGDTRYAVRILSKTDDEYACGGFAAMVSDYIFGPNANNACRRLNDNTQVRPGDIVVRVTGGKTRHVMIATTSVFYVNGRPAVMTADGNIGGMVNWSADNGQAIDSYTNSSGESVCVIYTRYPA